MVKIELLWRPEQRASTEIKYDFSTSESMCSKFFSAVPDTQRQWQENAKPTGMRYWMACFSVSLDKMHEMFFQIRHASFDRYTKSNSSNRIVIIFSWERTPHFTLSLKVLNGSPS